MNSTAKLSQVKITFMSGSNHFMLSKLQRKAKKKRSL